MLVNLQNQGVGRIFCPGPLDNCWRFVFSTDGLLVGAPKSWSCGIGNFAQGGSLVIANLPQRTIAGRIT